MTCRSKSILFRAAVLIAAATQARATVNLSFTSSLLYAQPGDTVSFTGTLENTGATTVFLNGDSYTFPLPVDDTPFFSVPVALAAAEIWSGPLLNVMVPSGTAVGLYTGTFNVLGGLDSASADVLASATFGVQVVPEPSTMFGGLAAGALAVLCSRRTRRRNHDAVSGAARRSAAASHAARAV